MAENAYAAVANRFAEVLRDKIQVCPDCRGLGWISLSWDPIAVDDAVCDKCSGHGVLNPSIANEVADFLEVLSVGKPIVSYPFVTEMQVEGD